MDTTPTPRYMLLAGNLCLDFANTADWHESEQPVEMLTSFGDLLIWGRETDVLDADDVVQFQRAAEYTPETAIAVYERAITLREAVFRIFRLVARQQPVAPDDLKLLNAEVAQAHRHRTLIPLDEGYGWAWVGQDAALDRVLWDVAQSAADLLTSDGLARVRQCAGDPCGWLFFDTSRNRSRRWCNMEGCGNRAKARRYYERRRSQTPLTG
jgi:predicted RNA-binding Zn ribbon-like protein